MSPNPDPPATHSKQTETSLIVLLILVGLMLAVLNDVMSLNIKPLIVAVFLAIAVSAIVYRFLGGIGEQKFGWGGKIVFSGALAALVGSAFLFNYLLEKQAVPTMEGLFNPPASQWFAVSNETRTPIAVNIPLVKDTIPKASDKVFENVALDITRKGDGQFAILRKDFEVGGLSAPKIIGAGFRAEADQEFETFVVTDRHATQDTIDLSPLALTLITGRYAREFSGYSLFDSGGNLIKEGDILRRNGHVFEHGGSYYVVVVVAVNHDPPDNADPWAKFAVGKLEIKVRS